MRYSVGATLRYLSLVLVLETNVFITHAWSPPSLKPRSDPITIQLYADRELGHPKLSNRSPADNATFGAGLTRVNLSENQQ